MKFVDIKRKFSGKAFGNRFAKTSVVGPGCEVKGSSMGEHARLKPNTELRKSAAGDYSVIGPSAMVNGAEIGKFCSIGPGVYIGLWEHNLHWVTTHAFPLSEACGAFVKGFKDFEKDALKTTVGHDVWIGANVTILKGVTIGHGAVLGAGCVVTRDVPPYAVVAGVPAKVLRYRFPPEHIAELLALKWWDFDRKTLSAMAAAGVWDSFEKVRAFCSRAGLSPRPSAAR